MAEVQPAAPAANALPGDATVNPFTPYLGPGAAAPADPNNPFEQLQKPDPGGLSDVMHGFKAGGVDVPKMAAQSGAYVGHALHAVGLDKLGDAITGVAQRAAQSLSDMEGGPGTAQSIQGQEGGFIRRNMYGLGRMAGQLGGAAVGGAVVGGGYGAVVGGLPLAAAGAVTGALRGITMALPALFAGSTAEETTEGVTAAKKAQGASDEQANSEGVQAGAVTGTVAGVGAALFNKIGLGDIAEPFVKAIGGAAKGEIVSSVLNVSLKDAAKSIGGAAVKDAALNAGMQDTIQGLNASNGVGEGPTWGGTADAALQGGIIGGVMHGAGELGHSAKVSATVQLLGDPKASPVQRQQAAIGASTIIATRDPQLAQDFALYADNQIDRGLPIQVGPDALYTGSADMLRQQQADDAAKPAINDPARTTQDAYPNFAPTGDEAPVPGAVTDPNAPAPATAPTTALGIGPNRQGGAAGTAPSWVTAAESPTLPKPPTPPVVHSAPPTIEETIGGIMRSQTPQEAFQQFEQSVGKGIASTIESANAIGDSIAAGVADANRLGAAAGVVTPEGAEATPSAGNLEAERAFYEGQRNQAQADMRAQAIDAAKPLTPPVPANAFEQREAQVAAAQQAIRDNAFDQAHREQLAAQADQATAVSAANEPTPAAASAGVKAPGAPAPTTAVGSQLHDELDRVANIMANNPRNVTTSQIRAVAQLHPDEAVRQAAQNQLELRKNAGITQAPVSVLPEGVRAAEANEPIGGRQVANIDAAGTMSTGEPKPQFSTGRGQEPTEGAPTQAAEPLPLEKTDAAVAPVKAALDQEAQSAGRATSSASITPVDPATLPDERTAANNGVQGATTLSKSDFGLAQKVAAMFGKKVVLFRQQGGETGLMDGMAGSDGKTIYLNADASGAHHLLVVGHELAHTMRMDAPKLFDGLRKSILKQTTKGQLGDFYRYYMNDRGMSEADVRAALKDKATFDRMTEEYVADLVGNRFGEYRTWQDLFANADKGDRSLIYRIADYITSFIDKLLGNAHFQKFATDDMVGNLTSVRQSVRRALAEYANGEGSKQMQHEADQLRARQENRVNQTEPRKLVEPVEPRVFLGKEPSKRAPAPVEDRPLSSQQGSREVEPIKPPEDRSKPTPIRPRAEGEEPPAAGEGPKPDEPNGPKPALENSQDSRNAADDDEYERDVREFGEPSFFERIARQSAEREALADKLVEGKGPNDSVEFKHPDGRSALAGPDASKPGGFRITRFDSEGPFGHGERPTLRDAVMDALRDGYQPVETPKAEAKPQTKEDRELARRARIAESMRREARARYGEPDVEKDSMLTAMAKLGGVKRAQLIGAYGGEAADHTFIHRGTMRAAHDGRTAMPVDDMVQALHERGYLEHPDWDEFNNKYERERDGGKPVYTPEGEAWHAAERARLEAEGRSAQEAAELHAVQEYHRQRDAALADLPPDQHDLVTEELEHEPYTAAEEAEIAEAARSSDPAEREGAESEYFASNAERPGVAGQDRAPVAGGSAEGDARDAAAEPGAPRADGVRSEVPREVPRQREPGDDDEDIPNFSRQRSSEGRPDFELTGETHEEGQARMDAEKAARKEMVRKALDEEKRLQAEQDAKDFRLTGSDRDADASPDQGALFSRQRSPFITKASDPALERMEKRTISEMQSAAPAQRAKLAEKLSKIQAEQRDRAAAKAPDTQGDTLGAREKAPYLGKLNPRQLAAARRAGAVTTPKTLRQQMESLKQDLGKKLIQGIADQFYPIKELSPQAYMSARLSKGYTGTFEAGLLYGKPFLRDGVPDVNVNDKGYVESVLAPLRGEHNRFFLWMAAHRAEELAKPTPEYPNGRENLFTDADISALKTLDRADPDDPASQGREQRFAEALEKHNEFNKAILDMVRESGLIDEKTAQKFSDNIYVPFYRVMDDSGKMKGPGGGGDGLINQSAWKSLKGGTNQLNQDLLANVLNNWAHLLGASARNRAALLTMDAAKEAGAAVKYDHPGEADKGAVRVMRDGKAEYWSVNDQHLLTAVHAITATVPSYMKPLTTFKRMLTFGTTISPKFRIANLIRDTLSTLATTDISLNAAKNLRQGWKSQAHDSQTHASMLASGGIINFGTMLEGNEAARVHKLTMMGVKQSNILDNPAKVDAFWKKMQQVGAWYHEVGNKVENANRGALYEQMIARGASHAEASFAARDIMDFSLQGTAPLVRFLTTSVPFLNARIQGAYKLGRATAENPKRALSVMGAVGMGSLALMLANQDDPAWKARPDWDRDNYWWFKAGGEAWRIPKPFEVGAVGTLMERTWERMFDPEMTSSRYVNELRSVLMNQFNLDPRPQIAKPLWDVYANKDSFLGRPIETDAMQQLQPEDRYTPNTTMTARFLGSLGMPEPSQLLLGDYKKLSPVQIESLVKGYMGWAGMAVLNMADAVLRPGSANGEKPAWNLKDYTGGFVESLPANQSRYVDQMYSQKELIDQAYNSRQEALRTGQFQKAQDIMDTQRAFSPSNRNLMRQHDLANTMAQTEARFSLQEKRVLDSPNLSADTKRAMLDQINQRRNEVAQRASMAELNIQQNGPQ
ncbi:LPD38 domain-containing protein [Paraburkholderia youngii]|uniref:LPD38 domain-containing protein n=1 Tax=Paraburkholderia youngii TaxID=2782701 RepID=UPI00159271EC|nr:LPD38 domain-containing protein [Paraburkholderia youngii]NUX58641.1 hypothetical protein [Paraburkholderia youngii]